MIASEDDKEVKEMITAWKWMWKWLGIAWLIFMIPFLPALLLTDNTGTVFAAFLAVNGSLMVMGVMAILVYRLLTDD